MVFSEARCRGFLLVLQFPPLLYRVMVSANKIKTKINAISALSNLIAKLRVKWRTAGCTRQALDVLHVICLRLRQGHLSVRVGDSSRRREEIVKISS